MINVLSYRLENGKFYNEITNVYYNKVRYMLLVNTNDDKDICIRKLVVDGNNKFIVRLDPEEYELIKEKIILKNKDLFNI